MDYSITGPWRINIGGKSFTVPPLFEQSVTDERHPELPVYHEERGYNNGKKLDGTETAGDCQPDALVPGSLVLKLEDGTVLERGTDYGADERWGTIGRLEGGRISPATPVLASYRFVPPRVDSIVLTRNGIVKYWCGSPKCGCPSMPELPCGETRLCNIYLERMMTALDDAHIFPVLERGFAPVDASDQQAFIPKAMAKLINGEPLTILAWGDSVTECLFMPMENSWQYQFITRLRKAFPKADIRLKTEGWTGHSLKSYLREPTGSVRNYHDKVLKSKADLVIMEFVNDASLQLSDWEATFPVVLKDLRERGMEWLIHTPHYIRTDWMGLTAQKGSEIESDPRPYVAFLRRFAAENGIALAEASARWGQLWKQGIPYNTLMTDSINHPNRFGMRLFADALMAIFAPALQ